MSILAGSNYPLKVTRVLVWTRVPSQATAARGRDIRLFATPPSPPGLPVFTLTATASLSDVQRNHQEAAPVTRMTSQGSSTQHMETASTEMEEEPSFRSQAFASIFSKLIDTDWERVQRYVGRLTADSQQSDTSYGFFAARVREDLADGLRSALDSWNK